MPLPRFAAALGALLLAACLPDTPHPPAEFGVHVAAAGNDSARAKFTVVVKGSLELGIRSTIVAMEPDSSLLLATPADLVVNKGFGSAVIAAADSAVDLQITPLDHADSARATARGHAVRLTRADSARHVTVQAVASPPPTSEPHR